MIVLLRRQESAESLLSRVSPEPKARERRPEMGSADARRGRADPRATQRSQDAYWRIQKIPSMAGFDLKLSSSWRPAANEN